ncbi:MAG TPA: hypothetical protein VFC50_00205 [Candidatus Dormibacteraeota bacterium]|nr:hypothetical protein [Candidatus Dormibacteraeota bacterium]
MAIDFEQEVIGIANMVKPHDAQISDDTIALSIEVALEVDERYGLGSDHQLDYHNGEHGLDVARCVTILNNIIYPYVPPRYQPQLFDLGLLGGVGNDYEQELGPGANEAATGAYLVAKVQAQGSSEINNPDFRDRLYDGIQATVIEKDEDGRIIQPNIREGSQDPFRWSLPTGDVNGVAIEGSARMFKDATRLCFEEYGNPTLDQIYDFLISQAGFLRDRVDDEQVRADMAHFFPLEVDQVYADMTKAFHGNIISAYALAKALDRHRELKGAVGLAVKGASLLDRSLLGDRIGRAVHTAAEALA